VAKVDILNWLRYFHLFKSILAQGPSSLLEIGVGSGILRNCLAPLVGEYRVMDVNKMLGPDYQNDVRANLQEIHSRFEAIIAADVLEHIPFGDVSSASRNILDYLVNGGRAYITIPHRASHFMFMSPTYAPHYFRVPTGLLSLGGFYRRFIKQRIWIDPNHCWEIGDGKIHERDVHRTFEEAGFRILEFRRIIYVDYWVLEKE